MNPETAKEDVLTLDPGAAVVYDEPLKLNALRSDVVFFTVVEVAAYSCIERSLRAAGEHINVAAVSAGHDRANVTEESNRKVLRAHETRPQTWHLGAHSPVDRSSGAERATHRAGLPEPGESGSAVPHPPAPASRIGVASVSLDGAQTVGPCPLRLAGSAGDAARLASTPRATPGSRRRPPAGAPPGQAALVGYANGPAQRVLTQRSPAGWSYQRSGGVGAASAGRPA